MYGRSNNEKDKGEFVMSIPNNVKVGGISYHIIYQKMKGLECSAVVSFNDATITINDDLVPGKQFEALIHEIFEIINEGHEMKLPHRNIMTLGTSLHQVIVDNPEIFK